MQQDASNVTPATPLPLLRSTEIRRADGTFAPGVIQPKSGRKPGIPNKATTRMREFWESFVEGKLEKLNELWERVAKDDPKAAIDIVLTAQEYFLAKLHRIELVERPLASSADELTDEELERIASRPPAPSQPDDPAKAN